MYVRALLSLIAVAEVVNGQFCGRPVTFPSIVCSNPGYMLNPLAYSGDPRPPFPYLGGLGGLMRGDIGPGTIGSYGVPEGDPAAGWNGHFGAGSRGGSNLISGFIHAGRGLGSRVGPGYGAGSNGPFRVGVTGGFNSISVARQGSESGFGSTVEAGSAKGSIGSGFESGQFGRFSSATPDYSQSGEGVISFNGRLAMTPGSFGGMNYQGFDPYGLELVIANRFGIQGIVNIGNNDPNTLVGTTFRSSPFPNSLGLMDAQGSIGTSNNNPQANLFQSPTQTVSDPNLDNGGGTRGTSGITYNVQCVPVPRNCRTSSCCSSKCKSYNSRGGRATT